MYDEQADQWTVMCTLSAGAVTQTKYVSPDVRLRVLAMKTGV